MAQALHSPHTHALPRKVADRTFSEGMRSAYLLSVYFLYALAGTRDYCLPNHHGYELLWTALLACALSQICFFDSRLRGYPIPTLSSCLLTQTVAISGTTYMLWSRGFLGLLLLGAHFVGFVLMRVTTWYLTKWYLTKYVVVSI